jgi:hypothetical protein
MQIDYLRFKKLSQKEKERRRKEDLCLCCGGENHQVWDCPIKASASKLHKVRNISTNIQSKVEDAKLKNEDIHPQSGLSVGRAARPSDTPDRPPRPPGKDQTGVDWPPW